MIRLYLTTDLARHIAEHLPEHDTLRVGLAELIAEQELFPGEDESPALEIYRHGRFSFATWDEAHAQRIEDVLAAPRAWPIVRAQRKAVA